MVNAICHRDYGSPSNIQIRVFDDRMEIWNPGMPPPSQLIVEDIKKKHESVSKNPLIAKQFFWIKFIEEVGTGTNDMIDLCLNGELPQLDFEEIVGSSVVTFTKSKLTGEFLEGLNDRQRKRIEYLKAYKRITTKEYSDMFNMTEKMDRLDVKLFTWRSRTSL